MKEISQTSGKAQTKDTQAVLEAALKILDDKKGENVNVLRVKEFATIFDYFVIATCSSGRQMWALAQELHQKMKEFGINVMIQGNGTSDWILADLGDIIVHLFKPEAREFYDLDGMWAAKTRPSAD